LPRNGLETQEVPLWKTCGQHPEAELTLNWALLLCWGTPGAPRHFQTNSEAQAAWKQSPRDASAISYWIFRRSFPKRERVPFGANTPVRNGSWQKIERRRWWPRDGVEE